MATGSEEPGPYDAEDAANMPPAPSGGKSHETDFVVIGSGLGGLSAGALLVQSEPLLCSQRYSSKNLRHLL